MTGNCWVLHVDEHYQEAIVGTPDRKYLWLLARTSTISEQRYAVLVAKANRLGYDTSRILKDEHRSGSKPQRTQP